MSETLDEEPIKVKKIDISGKKYYIDSNNNLYDRKTNELIGVFDRTNNTIKFNDEEEDDEEEEDLRTIEINTINSGKIEVDYDPNTLFLYEKGTNDKIGIYDILTNSSYLLGEGGNYYYDDDYMEGFNELINTEEKEYISSANDIDKQIEEVSNAYQKTTDKKEKKELAKNLKKLIEELEVATDKDRTEKQKLEEYNSKLRADKKQAIKNRTKLLEKIRLELLKKLTEKRKKKVKIQEPIRVREENPIPFILQKFVSDGLEGGYDYEERYKKIANLYQTYNEKKSSLSKDFKKQFITKYNDYSKKFIDELTETKRQLKDQAKHPEKYSGDQNETKKSALKELAIVKKILDDFTGKEGTGIDNPELYEKAKLIADNLYAKPSAYKSGFIVKTYKELGGTYSGEKPSKTGIARWFKEEWKDIGNKEYPVYRPTKRITKETPLTPNEIKPSNLKKQIALKQEIKGDENLPPFEKKGGGKVVPVGIALDKISQYDDIWKYSNPKKVKEMAEKYLGKEDANFVFRSSNPKKKYMIYDKVAEKWVFFGEMGYEDFTKHQDEKRRKNYLTRTANMKGNWKDNKLSANNLSRNILW